MIIPESIPKDVARAGIWFFFRHLAGVLPPGADLSFLRAFGRAAARFDHLKREQVKAVIKAAESRLLTDHSLSDTIDRLYETHFLNQYLVFLFGKISLANMPGYHRFKGLHHIDKARSKGRGCIIVHGHFGPAQLPLLHLNCSGYPVTQIGYHHDGERLSRFGKAVQSIKIRLECKSDVPIIMADSFLRPVFRALKKNEIIMITGDGTGGEGHLGKYIPVSFLGQTVNFPAGPAALALKTGAVMVPAFTIPVKKRFETVIEPGFALSAGHNLADGQTVKQLTQKFARKMEYYVRLYPFHWHFWDEFIQGGLIQC